MTLHEEGRFHLDQPLSQYLPQFANPEVLETDGSTERLVPSQRKILIKDRLPTHLGFRTHFWPIQWRKNTVLHGY
jgi:hypothetical protein